MKTSKWWEAREIQPGAIAAYSHIESWWGEELTPKLARRIATSSRRELEPFVNAWPRPHLDSEYFFDLPELAVGELRPSYGHVAMPWDVEQAGLSVLLYAPRVIVDHDWLLPFLGDESLPWNHRGYALAKLHRLATVRPLVADGAILFGNRWRILSTNALQEYQALLDAQPSSWHPHDPWIDRRTRAGLETILKDSGGGLDERFVDSQGYAMTLTCNLELSRTNKATPLAMTAEEEHVYSLALGNRRLKDDRLTKLSHLARIQVPDMPMDLDALVKVRRQSDAFHTWREALGTALGAVRNLPDEEHSIAEAKGIVANELAVSLERIRKEATSSAVLSNLQVGWRGFGLSGLGAGVPMLATGEPALAAGAAAAGAIVGGALDGYLRARKERREARAVWDVFLSFREGDTGSAFGNVGR